VLLRVGTDHEGSYVYHPLTNTDVALLDENASVVDRLCETLLENLGLKAALEETLGGQLKYVIQLVLVLSEETVPNHPPEKCLTFEDALGVLGVKGQQVTSSSTNFRENELSAPDLALAAETILTTELELLVEAL